MNYVLVALILSVVTVIAIILITRVTTESFSPNDDIDRIEPFNPSTLDDPNHDKITKRLNQNYSKCEMCSKLEHTLLQSDLQNRRRIFNDQSVVLPKSSCPTCAFILRAWRSYYEVLKSVHDYRKNGTWPQPPSTTSYSQPSCQEAENFWSEYGKKFSRWAKSNEEGIPREGKVPESASSCPRYEDIYRKWRLYEMKLFYVRKWVKR